MNVALTPLRISLPRDSDADEEFSVEFEVLPPPSECFVDSRQDEVDAGLSRCSEHLKALDDRIAELNSDIDRLTNHADGWDYAIAVTCGVVAGIIDSIFVGAWDFEKAKGEANKDINKMIEDYSKKLGWKYDPSRTLNGQKMTRLEQAVEFLEKKFPFPGDNDFKGNVPGVSLATHHLDDFAHHPTLVGLICSIVRQFTQTANYHGRLGSSGPVPIHVNDLGELSGDIPETKIFCGVVNWLFNFLPEEWQKVKSNTEGHWMSDLAGSKQTAGKGSGLPGSFLSFLKEISAIPIFEKQDSKGNTRNAFAEVLRRAFEFGIGDGKYADGSPKQVDLGIFNCLFEGADSKLDFRTELAVKKLLEKQAIPVIVNECLVRALYFVRHLIMEVKEKKSLKAIELRKVIPFGNRTVARMLTISSGTFTACDMADAAIRSGVKNGFCIQNPKFWTDFVLRVNFVGIGRFAVAVATDFGMGIKKGAKEVVLTGVRTERNLWQNASVFYRQGNMWIAAENTAYGIECCERAMCLAFEELDRTWSANKKSLDEIEGMVPAINGHNPGLLDQLVRQSKFHCR